MYGNSSGSLRPENYPFIFKSKKYVDEVIDIDRQGQTREWKGLFDNCGVDVQITCLGIVSSDIINNNIWEPRLRSYIEREGEHSLAIYGFSDRMPDPPSRHRGLNNIGFSLVGKKIKIYRPFISEEEIARTVSKRLFYRYEEQMLLSWELLKYITSMYGNYEVKLSDLESFLSKNDESSDNSIVYETLDFIQRNTDLAIFGNIRRGCISFDPFSAKVALYGKRFIRSWEFSTIFSKLTHKVKEAFVEQLSSEVINKSQETDRILVLTNHDTRDRLLNKLSQNPGFLRTE